MCSSYLPKQSLGTESHRAELETNKGEIWRQDLLGAPDKNLEQQMK